MPKKKTIPPPDDFSSEFMETESAKELSEQQVESAGSDNTETPLAEPSEVDLGSGDVSGTADVGETSRMPKTPPMPQILSLFPMKRLRTRSTTAFAGAEQQHSGTP